MLKIYDSKLKKKVEFKPLKKGEIKMYVCGPTVYDKAHLGHGRSAVSFDVIRKYFEYKGNKVLFVSNYTDIDDKMINRAKEAGVSISALANEIIPEYEKDYSALGVLAPTIQPRATNHIKEIVKLIELLENKGYTYVLDDGVYFDVSKFKEYGRLSGQNLDDLKMGARIDVNDKKRNAYDFVLWKFKKEGEPFWASPWGEGRPGWHIECSAMTWKHLGEKFDIHGGGLDLKFPHHECEVAQSCCVFGSDSFAMYWMHNGFIQVNNEKMSKSLGNFSTLQDIFKKYDPQVVRFMFLQTHYRNPINFSDILLEQAKASINRIHEFLRVIDIEKQSLIDGKIFIDIDKYRKTFEEFMDNDFDTSGAFGVIFDLLNETNSLRNSKKLTKRDVDNILRFLAEIDKVLGVVYPKEVQSIDGDVGNLIKEREEARRNKDFKKSDKIRAELLKRGIILEDTSNGTIWKKA